MIVISMDTTKGTFKTFPSIKLDIHVWVPWKTMLTFLYAVCDECISTDIMYKVHTGFDSHTGNVEQEICFVIIQNQACFLTFNNHY